MEDVKQYLDCDVYQVEVDKTTGKKVIHIDGYCFFNDEDYQLVQVTFCYMDIDGTQNSDKADELFSLTKQYQQTVTLKEAQDYYKNCKPLTYEKVTQDTPVGLYVNI